MDDGGAAAEGPLIPGRPVAARVHIKKRALRNKALSVGFDEKQLQDFVGGFHKRKKKRRKVAQQQQMEKDRLRRIAARKRRKLEKEFALHGGTLPKEGSQEETEYQNEMEEHEDEDNEPNGAVSVSGTKTYQSGDMMITVTTSELAPEAEEERPSRTIASDRMITARKQNLCVKKKPLKETGKKRHRNPKKHGSHKKAKKGRGRR